MEFWCRWLINYLTLVIWPHTVFHVLSITGHHTLVLNLSFVFIIPWWPSCTISIVHWWNFSQIAILLPWRTSFPRQVSSSLRVLYLMFRHFSHLSDLMHSLTAVNSWSAAAASILWAVVAFRTDVFATNSSLQHHFHMNSYHLLQDVTRSLWHFQYPACTPPWSCNSEVAKPIFQSSLTVWTSLSRWTVVDGGMLLVWTQSCTPTDEIIHMPKQEQQLPSQFVSSSVWYPTSYDLHNRSLSFHC